MRFRTLRMQRRNRATKSGRFQRLNWHGFTGYAKSQSQSACRNILKKPCVRQLGMIFQPCCTRLTKLGRCQKSLWNAEYDLFSLKDFRTQKSTAHVFGLTARLLSACLSSTTESIISGSWLDMRSNTS